MHRADAENTRGEQFLPLRAPSSGWSLRAHTHTVVQCPGSPAVCLVTIAGDLLLGGQRLDCAPNVSVGDYAGCEIVIVAGGDVSVKPNSSDIGFVMVVANTISISAGGHVHLHCECAWRC